MSKIFVIIAVVILTVNLDAQDMRNAQDHIDQGYRFQIAGQFDRAIEHFSRAIDLTSRPQTDVRSLGNNLSERESIEDAMLRDRIRILDPRTAVAYVYRATAYIGIADLDRAIADCDRAIAIAPGYVHSYVSRGVALIWKGNFDAAIADFAKAIKLEPKFVKAYVVRETGVRHVTGKTDRRVY